MFAHNSTIILSGGWNNSRKCLQLQYGTWKEHSTLNKERVWHSAIATQTATFIFGGCYSAQTYEYLPKDSTKWLMGKTEIPISFTVGCAIAVKSEQEIWLIRSNIISFNVNDHTFQILPFSLNMGRWGHKCAFIPNTNKVMITGGYSRDSTEILDVDNGSIVMASPMKIKRMHHGMGVVTIKGKDRLAVLGGNCDCGSTKHDSVELYNTCTEKWETTDIKFKDPKDGFGFLTIKGDNIKHEYLRSRASRCSSLSSSSSYLSVKSLRSVCIITFIGIFVLICWITASKNFS